MLAGDLYILGGDPRSKFSVQFARITADQLTAPSASVGTDGRGPVNGSSWAPPIFRVLRYPGGASGCGMFLSDGRLGGKEGVRDGWGNRRKVAGNGRAWGRRPSSSERLLRPPKSAMAVYDAFRTSCYRNGGWAFLIDTVGALGYAHANALPASVPEISAVLCGT